MSETDVPERLMDMPVTEFPAEREPATAALKKADPEDLKLAYLSLNDYGNGLRLQKRRGRDLLAVSRIGWHVWDNKRFNREHGDEEATKAAHKTVLAMADELKALQDSLPSEEQVEKRKAALDRIDKFAKFKVGSGNSARIRSMLESARPYLVCSAKLMDANPWLLNCDNGTLDLQRTLEPGCEEGAPDPRLRAHNRADKMTKLSPVAFDPDADCPVFRKFLAQVQPDPSVQLFLQTWFGYCLSGDVSEQKLVIMHGLGSNGKSTLINTLVAVMGDYAVTLDIASFMANDKKRGGDATPDLARLPGTRLVVASEPEPGARLNESSVKVITGGERMAVRQLFQEQFEFEPNFKVVILCNHRPVITGQDHGIWRRILVTPFAVTLTPDMWDPHLKEKLVAESPGILGWLLDGLAIYRERGLVIPQAVQDAIDEYRNDSDPVGQFINTCLEPAPRQERVSATQMFDHYTAWCKLQAREPMSQNAFSRKMTGRGYKTKVVGVRFYEGLILLPLEEA